MCVYVRVCAVNKDSLTELFPALRAMDTLATIITPLALNRGSVATPAVLRRRTKHGSSSRRRRRSSRRGSSGGSSSSSGGSSDEGGPRTKVGFRTDSGSDDSDLEDDDSPLSTLRAGAGRAAEDNAGYLPPVSVRMSTQSQLLGLASPSASGAVGLSAGGGSSSSSSSSSSAVAGMVSPVGIARSPVNGSGVSMLGMATPVPMAATAKAGAGAVGGRGGYGDSDSSSAKIAGMEAALREIKNLLEATRRQSVGGAGAGAGGGHGGSSSVVSMLSHKDSEQDVKSAESLPMWFFARP